MPAQHAPQIAFFVVAVWSAAALAGDPELTPGQAREGSLSPGQAQAYAVRLGEGDFARIGVKTQGLALVLRTYTPGGKPFRGTAVGPEEGRLDLLAEAGGEYRVEVKAADKQAKGSYTITLAKVVTLEARLAPLKPLVESPRMRALEAAVRKGDGHSVEVFWADIGKSGAPLIEPIPGDAQNMAVTFLWRGQPWTHNVAVLWLPYIGLAPDEYMMARIGGTDVWYKTIKVDRKMRLPYTLAPNATRIRPVALEYDQNVLDMAAASARPDPLNPKRYGLDQQSPDAPEFRGQSVLEMPDAPPQPWIVKRAGVAAGRLERRRFKSVILNNEREVAIYLPAGYSAQAEPYALLVLFDERVYSNDGDRPARVPTPTILDNLIAARRIPPTVALLVDNPSEETRTHELPGNPEFFRALATELVPWAHGLYNFTRDPAWTVVAGSSFGGLGAACAGLWHPETFGNVLSMSGAFHFVPEEGGEAGDASGEPNWMARQFIASPKLALRFYMDAGIAEFNAGLGGDSILLTTRALRDVLRAKGYEVHFQEFAGGHEPLSWRGSLPDGLIALIGADSSKQPR